MSSRDNAFWYVFLIVLIVLILAILALVVLAPKPGPIANRKKPALPLVWISEITGITSPARESPEVNFYVDGSCRIGKYQKLEGWLFVENRQSQGQKVYVQLEKPDGAVVHYSTLPLERPDVAGIFKNPFYSASGFSALIPLRDGLDVGACTIRFVVINRNGTYRSPIWQRGIRISSRVETPILEIKPRPVAFYVDVNEDRKQGIFAYRYLCGWAHVAGQRTRGQKVYVQLEKPDGAVVHYSTLPLERPDVAGTFKNPFYDASGFSALIPLRDGLDVGACTIRFVVINRSGTYRSPIWQKGIRISSRVEIPILEIKPRPVAFNVDVDEDRKQGIFAYRYLCGWAHVAGQRTRGQNVYVQLEKPDGAIVHYSTLPLERPDVGGAFGNPMYNASGFHAVIPLKEGLEIDECSITFVIRNRFGTYRSSVWKKKTRDDPEAGEWMRK